MLETSALSLFYHFVLINTTDYSNHLIFQDLISPPQPPVVINAKSYSASIKHYLTKTKLSVGA